MTNLSVVIPVFNAKECLELTISHILHKTTTLRELILVDDNSDKPTQNWIDGLQFEDRMRIRLIKTRNPKHSWTNASWNMGVTLTHEPYIAILNSDVIVGDNWDLHLIETLKTKTIACPYEILSDGSKNKLDPVIERVHPGMIKGACYMFKREDMDMFPIDSRLTHWCGDNYLADEAEKRNGVGFNEKATIVHGITRSGRLIDPKVYNEICKNDVLTYQRLSGRDMSIILRNFQ